MPRGGGWLSRARQAKRAPRAALAQAPRAAAAWVQLCPVLSSPRRLESPRPPDYSLSLQPDGGGAVFVLLTGLGLFEMARRRYLRDWGETQEWIEREIKRREAL